MSNASPPEASIPNADETFGVIGYTTKGRLSPCHVIYHHPDGGHVSFESIRKNGVDGVIVEWIGDGVLIMPVECFAAIAELMSPESYLTRLRAASAIEAAAAGETRSGSTEGESTVPKGDADA